MTEGEPLRTCSPSPPTERTSGDRVLCNLITFWNGVMIRVLVSAALTALVGLPGAGQTVCRPSALGDVRCQGLPSTGQQEWPLYQEGGGLSGIQRPLREAAPRQSFVPALRTDAFGNTRPQPRPSADRPRRCRSSALGHLRCQ